MAYKIWLIKEPGGSFQEAEIAPRTLASNEVLVRIHASGVNPLDTKNSCGES